MTRSLTEFSARLLDWFDAHGRKDLPWQGHGDPYRTWVSEIMLQQTQVQTVIPYFTRFMASFPDVRALANAPQDDVLRHWSGLGYYARARNLHKAARVIRDLHGGDFPTDFDAVLDLPGIGRSTAGAILAQACGQRYPILDGNAKRVLARHAAVPGWPGTAAVAKRLWDQAERYTPAERVADYTQAIMDLGATRCTRRRPACDACPVAGDCRARQMGTVTEFPGRRPQRTRPLRETTMLVARHKGRVWLERRPPAGIWGGLWSLPELGDATVEAWCGEQLRCEIVATERLDTLRHRFSHFDLDIHPLLVRIRAPSRKVADSPDGTWHALDAEPPGGIAAPVSRLIEQLRKGTNVTQN